MTHYLEQVFVSHFHPFVEFVYHHSSIHQLHQPSLHRPQRGGGARVARQVRRVAAGAGGARPAHAAGHTRAQAAGTGAGELLDDNGILS